MSDCFAWAVAATLRRRRYGLLSGASLRHGLGLRDSDEHLSLLWRQHRGLLRRGLVQRRVALHFRDVPMTDCRRAMNLFYRKETPARH